MKKYLSCLLLVFFVGIITACNPSGTSTTLNTTTEKPQDYIGLKVEDAQKMAAEKNTAFRVVMKDGQTMPTTRDYRPGRINATVEKETVVSYTVEGEEVTADTYDENSWKTMIPETCISYFDGCNDCRREPSSHTGACTKKLCFNYQMPTCLD